MSRRPLGTSNGYTSQEPIPLADLARLRQGAYRLFSQTLLYPDDQRLHSLAQVARELRQEQDVWESFAFFPKWDTLIRSLVDMDTTEATSVQNAYLSTFAVNGAGVPCPPYESAYLGGDPSATGLLLAELERGYGEVGLSPSPALREPPDHGAVELEFMSFLCSQEALAWKGGMLSHALPVLRQESSFLRNHLLHWFPAFSARVADYDADGLFTVIAEAASAFIMHDADLVDTLLQMHQGVGEAHGSSQR